MKNRTVKILISLIALLAYYSVLFFIAQMWYRGEPQTVEWVFGSPVFMAFLYSAFVIVPAHVVTVMYLGFKRRLNAGELVMCLMAPIALAALFFPAKG